MKSAWPALALLLAAAPRALAQAPSDGVDTFREKVADVARTAADPAAAPGAIWEKGQNLFMNRVNVVVEPNLRGWDFRRGQLGDGKEKTLDELLAEGGERALSDLGIGVPPPELRDAVAGVRASYRDGRMRYSGDMAEEQMGRFLFTEGRPDPGQIEVNELMRQLVRVIGAPMAFMTPLHEWVHEKTHREGRLSAERVIDGEVEPFLRQWQWLTWIDPHGEHLAYSREFVANLERRGRGGWITERAKAYLNHAAEVRATGGDLDKIREMIHRLGYRDGHHPGDGHEHGPANPTRN